MKFIESSHKYLDGIQEFTPVTYFIKSFQEYVDWDKVAEKKAKKDGVSKEALLAEWDKTKNEAAAKGTAFHKFMEDQLIERGIVEVDNRKLEVLSYDTFAGVKEDSTMLLENDKTYVEKMIWSKKYGICGTADIVDVYDGRIHVQDYKTNKKLDKTSWFNPKTRKTKRLLSPLQSLDDCNFNIYQIQLNTYMYMLLQANRHLKMGDMTILHIIYNEDGTTTKVPHKVSNYQSMVKAMLEQFKSRK